MIMKLIVLTLAAVSLMLLWLTAVTRLITKTLWVAMMIGLTMAGCSNNSHYADGDSSLAGVDAKPVVSIAYQVGDEVVAEDVIGVLRHARVVEITSDDIVCEFVADKSKARIEKSRIANVSRSAEHIKNAIKQGDWAICKTSASHWEGCVISNINNGVFSVRDESQKSHQLKASDVVIPTQAMIETIRKRQLDTSNSRVLSGKQLHKTNMAAENKASVESQEVSKKQVDSDHLPAPDPNVQVHPPVGYEPAPDDLIVSKREDNQWYSGRVRRITPTKLHIYWDDKHPWSQVDYKAVIAQPTKAVEVKWGQQVLAPTKTKGKWSVFRVLEVRRAKVMLVDANQQQHTVRARELIVVQ